MTIFRIVQECLTNIHRHSGGKQATIRVLRTSQEVCVEIRDRGKGMPASNRNGSSSHPRSGVEIQGMRERVRQLNGRFEIQSDRNGTVVTARLPVTAASLAIACLAG